MHHITHLTTNLYLAPCMIRSYLCYPVTRQKNNKTAMLRCHLYTSFITHCIFNQAKVTVDNSVCDDAAPSVVRTAARPYRVMLKQSGGASLLHCPYKAKQKHIEVKIYILRSKTQHLNIHQYCWRQFSMRSTTSNERGHRHNGNQPRRQGHSRQPRGDNAR